MKAPNAATINNLSNLFFHELNYANLHKRTYSPEVLFNAAATVALAPSYPMDLLFIYSITQVKQDLSFTILPATLKTLFTSSSANAVIHNI